MIQKLDMLQKLEFCRGSRSRTNFVDSLKSLRKLRNIMAHSYSVHNEDQIKKLYSDRNIKKWILDYPKSLTDEKRNMEVRTTRLWNFAHATRKP